MKNYGAKRVTNLTGGATTTPGYSNPGYHNFPRDRRYLFFLYFQSRSASADVDVEFIELGDHKT